MCCGSASGGQAPPALHLTSCAERCTGTEQWKGLQHSTTAGPLRKPRARSRGAPAVQVGGRAERMRRARMLGRAERVHLLAVVAGHQLAAAVAECDARNDHAAGPRARRASGGRAHARRAASSDGP